MKYRVVEIFDSIDGEGIRTGLPVSFVRLAGCNLRCSYCDTLYSLFGEKEECVYEEMTKDEIIGKLNKNFMRVTLTGGEPLISEGVKELIRDMSDKGFEVNIETNGATDISDVVSLKNVFFTIDYKLPSSGMEKKMLWENFLKLKPCDVVKFVVGSDEDVAVMVSVVEKMKEHYNGMPQIFVGAVYEMFDYQKLVDVVMNTPELSNARIQIQLHKVIWNPEERGV